MSLRAFYVLGVLKVYTIHIVIVTTKTSNRWLGVERERENVRRIGVKKDKVKQIAMDLLCMCVH